jgi:hypothetical protein
MKAASLLFLANDYFTLRKTNLLFLLGLRKMIFNDKIMKSITEMHYIFMIGFREY